MQSSFAQVRFAAPRRSEVAPMALERVLRTLRLLADKPDGLTLSQLMAQIEAPKTSVHSLLQGLAAAAYVQRHDSLYRLGPESFVLGAALVAARSLTIVATPYLREARALSGETVLLAVIDRPCTAAGRVQILLDILRRQTRVDLPVSAVAPA